VDLAPGDGSVLPRALLSPNANQVVQENTAHTREGRICVRCSRLLIPPPDEMTETLAPVTGGVKTNAQASIGRPT
jgi:hypothetical protein